MWAFPWELADYASYVASSREWERAALKFWHQPSWSNGAEAGAALLTSMGDAAALLLPGIPATGGHARMAAGLLIKKVPIHHIATNKNWVSGGRWSERFEPLFERAGMTLEDGLNKVGVPNHYGPHPDAYHEAIHRALVEATDGLDGQAYTDALQSALRQLREDVATPGSALNKLLTER